VDAEEPRLIKLDLNTLKYKRGDINKWIFLMNEQFDILRVSDKDKLRVAGNYLKGLTSSMHYLFRTTKPDGTWKQFCDELIRTCNPHNKERQIRVQLKKLKHNGAFDYFIQKFLSIVNKSTTISELDKITFFVDALKPQAKYEVLAKNPKTLEEAIETAATFEQCREEAYDSTKINNNNKNYDNKQNKFRKEYKNNNNYNNNNNKNNYNNNNNNKNNYKNDKVKMNQIICHKCKRPGHVKKDCHVKGNNAKIREMNLVEARPQYSSTEDDEETISRKNMVKPISTSETLLIVDVEINGVELKAVLDTGASVSTVSMMMIEKLKLKINESKMKIQTANSQVSNVMGKT
jgi:hypothetical protein